MNTTTEFQEIVNTSRSALILRLPTAKGLTKQMINVVLKGRSNYFPKVVILAEEITLTQPQF